ncbi:uncharacterized protein LTR77_001760 [Saxophila tyrrhenica]|uniref:Uncharacterized protein n=1 Tax=Saxophila tyrrhenica TaxID=1690608 RepID=A0AAV9PL14_9PEZI|nr:hypothetical protein LTR77_001760 [Saxophila tyrrhenica]
MSGSPSSTKAQCGCPQSQRHKEDESEENIAWPACDSTSQDGQPSSMDVSDPGRNVATWLLDTKNPATRQCEPEIWKSLCQRDELAAEIEKISKSGDGKSQ